MPACRAAVSALPAGASGRRALCSQHFAGPARQPIAAGWQAPRHGTSGADCAAVCRRRCSSTAATATNSRLENGVLSSADALADDVLDVPQGRSSSLRRSAAAAAAVASAAAENEALASLDAAQLDAAIAAALQRVAATMATAGNGPSTQGSNGATNGTAAAASAAAAAAAPGDEESWHRFIEDEVHHAFEIEIQELNKAVHDAVEAEMSTTQQSMRDAVDAALADRSRGITANVNTLMAVTGVIAYWRGVGGLLDILLEDSLEGYVFCAFFGFGVIGLIRTLKLPVVEGGSGIGF